MTGPTSRQTLAIRLGGGGPLRSLVLTICEQPAGVSSAGFAYLHRQAWELLRDEVPVLFGRGLRLLGLLDRLATEARRVDLPAVEVENLERALQVIRQVVITAAITAPTDLWLLRFVLGWFGELGLSRRLLRGEAIYPEACRAEGRGQVAGILDRRQLEIDLDFLLGRGLVEQYDNSYRIAGHPLARRLFETLNAAPALPADAARRWAAAFGEAAISDGEAAVLEAFGEPLAGGRLSPVATHWLPAPVEVEIGHRLVPVVLGLRAVGRTLELTAGAAVDAESWCPGRPRLGAAAAGVLRASGWLERRKQGFRVTALGERGFARAPGPFGIIEAYHGYMSQGRPLLEGQAGEVWVERGENIAASQDANRVSFRRANDALDRFCRDHGFRYGVFIEHAIGHGEATRQRFERSGEAEIRYFGADLEDAAIDAALAEQRAGRLPRNMRFVRGADIGQPDILLDALRQAGVDPEGAVMMVGNGFHEVRGQTDERMVEVFSGYQEAGLLLIFTEESALSIDSLRATAWNTYHAGFKYVHEKSGQGLRPAEPGPPIRLGQPLPAPWNECAERAGYRCLDAYSHRSRTVFPHPRPDGHNPAISVTHFAVPRRIARRLGVEG